MDDTLTKTEREALKAIYRLTQGDEPAHTNDLADRLGVTPGTVTATVKRLAERALVDHRPYRGVELTDQGRRVAVAAIRRHRIVERFLSDMLGYPWHDADRLAPSFEHELPDEVLQRLYTALDRPDDCPHGFPIPAEETTEVPSLPPLYSLEPGQRALVAVPGATAPEVVDFLDQMGLRPGVVVEVREKHPFDGPVVLTIGPGTDAAAERTLGSRIASEIHVRALGPEPATGTAS